MLSILFRQVALVLSLTLALPHSALALRPVEIRQSSGLEELNKALPLSPTAGAEEPLSRGEMIPVLKKYRGIAYIDPKDAKSFPPDATAESIVQFIERELLPRGLLIKVHVPATDNQLSRDILLQLRMAHMDMPLAVALEDPHAFSDIVVPLAARNLIVTAPVSVIEQVTARTHAEAMADRTLVIAKVKNWEEVRRAMRAKVLGIEVEPADAGLTRDISNLAAGFFYVVGTAGGINTGNVKGFLSLDRIDYLGASVGPRTLDEKKAIFEAIHNWPKPPATGAEEEFRRQVRPLGDRGQIEGFLWRYWDSGYNPLPLLESWFHDRGNWRDTLASGQRIEIFRWLVDFSKAGVFSKSERPLLFSFFRSAAIHKGEWESVRTWGLHGMRIVSDDAGQEKEILRVADDLWAESLGWTDSRANVRGQIQMDLVRTVSLLHIPEVRGWLSSHSAEPVALGSAKRLKYLIGEVRSILEEERRRGTGQLRPRIEQIQSGRLFTQDHVAFLPAGKGRLVVVGDLHGDEAALDRVIAQSGYDSRKNPGLPAERQIYLVFVGDYADVGTRSLELINKVLFYKLRDPQHVVLLGGNHDRDRPTSEFAKEDKIPWFFKELEAILGKEKGSGLYGEFHRLMLEFPTTVAAPNGIVVAHASPPKMGAPSPSYPTRFQYIFDGARGLLEIADPRVQDQLAWNVVRTPPLGQPEAEEDTVVDPAKHPRIDQSTLQPGYWIGRNSFFAFMDSIGGKIFVRGHDRLGPADRALFDGRFLTVITTDHRSPDYGYAEQDQIIGRYAEFDLAKTYDRIDPSEVVHLLTWPAADRGGTLPAAEEVSRRRSDATGAEEKEGPVTRQVRQEILSEWASFLDSRDPSSLSFSFDDEPETALVRGAQGDWWIHFHADRFGPGGTSIDVTPGFLVRFWSRGKAQRKGPILIEPGDDRIKKTKVFVPLDARVIPSAVLRKDLETRIHVFTGSLWTKTNLKQNMQMIRRYGFILGRPGSGPLFLAKGITPQEENLHQIFKPKDFDAKGRKDAHYSIQGRERTVRFRILNLGSDAGAEEGGLREELPFNQISTSIATWVGHAMDVRGGADEVAIRITGPLGQEDMTFLLHEAVRRDWPAQISNTLGYVGVNPRRANHWKMSVGDFDEQNTDRRFFTIDLKPDLSAGAEETAEEMVRRLGRSSESVTVQQVEQLHAAVLREGGGRSSTDPYTWEAARSQLAGLVQWLNTPVGARISSGPTPGYPADFELFIDPFERGELDADDPVAHAALASFAFHFAIFHGGNHRTGWALMNIALLRSEVIREPLVWEESRKRLYYEALEELDLPKFVALVRSYLPPTVGAEEGEVSGRDARGVPGAAFDGLDRSINPQPPKTGQTLHTPAKSPSGILLGFEPPNHDNGSRIEQKTGQENLRLKRSANEGPYNQSGKNDAGRIRSQSSQILAPLGGQPNLSDFNVPPFSDPVKSPSIIIEENISKINKIPSAGAEEGRSEQAWVEILNDPTQPPERRIEAAYSLGWMNSRTADGVLIAVLANDPDPNIRQSAVIALEQRQTEVATKALLEADRTEKNPEVLKSIRKILGRWVKGYRPSAGAEEWPGKLSSDEMTAVLEEIFVAFAADDLLVTKDAPVLKEFIETLRADRQRFRTALGKAEWAEEKIDYIFQSFVYMLTGKPEPAAGPQWKGLVLLNRINFLMDSLGNVAEQIKVKKVQEGQEIDHLISNLIVKQAMENPSGAFNKISGKEQAAILRRVFEIFMPPAGMEEAGAAKWAEAVERFRVEQDLALLVQKVGYYLEGEGAVFAPALALFEIQKPLNAYVFAGVVETTQEKKRLLKIVQSDPEAAELLAERIFVVEAQPGRDHEEKYAAARARAMDRIDILGRPMIRIITHLELDLLAQLNQLLSRFGFKLPEDTSIQEAARTLLQAA